MWEQWLQYHEVSGTHQGNIVKFLVTHQGKDSSEMHIEMLMVLQRIADLHSNVQMNTLFPLAQTGV